MDDILIQRFLQTSGEAYLNTLDGGGGYRFLLNKVNDHPVLIINILNWSSGVDAKLIMDNEESLLHYKNLNELINKFQLNKIYINHLIWTNNFPEIFDEIINACKLIELNLYLHDFFSLCPTVNLLNFNGEYCGVPSYIECKNCIDKYTHSPNTTHFAKKQISLYQPELNGDIRNWRNLWLKIFDHVRFIIVPSQSTAEIFSKAYGNQYLEKIIVKPHCVKETKNIEKKKKVTKSSFMNIYLLGYIDEHKGSRILKDLVDKTAKMRLNICYHVLGWFEYPAYENTPFLKLHGAYKPEQLPDLINRLEVDMFIQPSICPETFSYVVHEMKATGIPILAFKLGAQADFLKDYPSSKLVDEISAQAMFKEIVNFYDKHVESLYPILQVNNLNGEVLELVKSLQKKNLECSEQRCLIDQYKIQVNDLKKYKDNFAREDYESDQFNALKRQLENANNIIHTIQNSRSWKITLPLRLLGKLARKF
ncbi:MAG: glycosyl transferase family 2 [Burkholderiales bacterium]|nr:glycosyl transferase family 2 [Burkholderiales bacterium]